jgi:hypothetical protein
MQSRLSPVAPAFLPKRKVRTVKVDLRCKGKDYDETLRLCTDLRALNISEPPGSPWQWITVNIRYRLEPRYLCGRMYEEYVWERTKKTHNKKAFEEIIVEFS